MKALFRNRFPFVELPDEELTDEQLLIKKEYAKTYTETPKADQLREVQGNDKSIRRGSK